MCQLGYVRHCVEAGKTCYHRPLDDPYRFPRFHAFISLSGMSTDIDLHIDQFNHEGKSNHAEEWSYQGGRVNAEMERIISSIKNPQQPRQVNRPNCPQPKPKPPKPKRKHSLFEILFK